MTSALPALNLLCHPATPCPLALQLSVTLHWQAQGLMLHYQARGEVGGMVLPPAAPPGPAAGVIHRPAKPTSQVEIATENCEATLETFTVTALDGTEHQVHITITGVNDAAVIGGDAS